MRIPITTLLFFMCTFSLFAQNKGVDANGNQVTAYYLDITSTTPATTPYTLDINDSSLDIQYHDYYGKAKSLELVLRNWKEETVATFQLEKEFGLNFFHIPLKAASMGLKKDETYSVQMSDEARHKHQLLIKWIKPVVAEIQADIVVNPRFLECSNPDGNNVEFYANLDGGKAPYSISWFVMNDHRTELLYQPRIEKIQRPGKTTSVMVDHAPDYYVLMLVVDACGNKTKQSVHLTCEEGKKKINTLFLYPLDKTGPVKTGN